MDQHLLLTKTHLPPRRPKGVDRPRLITKLESGLESDRKLTLVSAQAGAGKSTLIRDWLEAHLDRVCWLSLDPGDDQPVVFWRYAIAALHSRYPGLGEETLALLEAPGAHKTPSRERLQNSIILLINDIIRAGQAGILVLDDYHHITHEEIHQSLQFLLEHQPANLHLVILTRMDPPLPTSLLRARGQLTEIRLTDLRFTKAEAGAFLNQAMSLDLQSSEISAIVNRTEGWAVGLQMAGLSLQGHPNPRTFIDQFSGSHHFILQYLTQEVLNRQTDSVRKFLLRASILTQLTPGSCNHLLEREDAGPILKKLSRDNLFLIPQDDSHRHYRFHHLFQDLLQARLLQTEPDLFFRLHRKAARWYHNQGQGKPAVHHALQAQDFTLAADLAESYASTLWAHSDIEFLFWLDRLPENIINQRPGLLILHAWGQFINGNGAVVPGLLSRAEKLIPDPPPPDQKALYGFMEVLRTYQANLTGDTQKTIERAKKALRALPETAVPISNTIQIILALSLSQVGRLEEAEEALWACIQRDLSHHTTSAIPLAVSKLSQNYAIQGRWLEGEQLLERFQKTVEDSGVWRYYCAGYIYLAKAAYRNNAGKWDQAETLLQQAREINQRWGGEANTLYIYLKLGQVHLAKGELEKAQEDLDFVRRNRGKTFLAPDGQIELETLQARIHLARGNLPAVKTWLNNHPALIKGTITILNEPIWLVRAQYLIAAGEFIAALDHLHRMAENRGTRSRRGRLGEMLLLKALAEESLGDTETALRSLSQSLEIFAVPQYPQRFWDLGEPVRKILSSHLPAIVETPLAPFARKILARFTTPDDAMDQDRTEKYNLTKRETDVLACLCRGLTNQQITEQLFITIHTVKKHTSNLYRKLGVANRAQAILKAQSEKLIPD
jgi:LuxR family transcriptional regulator, maltose regulon positive regulatory protein